MLLGLGHHRLDAIGDLEHAQAAALSAELVRDLLDHLVARIGDCIDGMAKTDHDFLCREPAADVGFRLVRVGVALLHLERDFVGAAMFGPRSAPIAPVIAEYMSAPVPAIERAVKVEALNSCSA